MAADSITASGSDRTVSTTPIPATDPLIRHGAPAEARRLSRQCQCILDAFRAAGTSIGRPVLSNRHLAEIALKYTSRISDLRAAGYRIDVIGTDTRSGLVFYALGDPS